MIESYVRRAATIEDSSSEDFFATCGEATRAVHHLGLPPAEAGERIFDLCQRQARAVGAVLDAGLREHATDLRRNRLPDSCLLRLAIPASRVEPVAGPHTAAESPGVATRPNEGAADGVVVLDRAGRALVVRGERLEFAQAPARFAEIVRLCEARQKSTERGWLHLRKTGEKKAREQLRRALEKRRAGLADELLETLDQMGIRLKVVPEIR